MFGGRMSFLWNPGKSTFIVFLDCRKVHFLPTQILLGPKENAFSLQPCVCGVADGICIPDEGLGNTAPPPLLLPHWRELSPIAPLALRGRRRASSPVAHSHAPPPHLPFKKRAGPSISRVAARARHAVMKQQRGGLPAAHALEHREDFAMMRVRFKEAGGGTQ